MTSLIDQLYDIAQNEEFSPEQRKNLMQIVVDEHEVEKFIQQQKSINSFDEQRRGGPFDIWAGKV